MVIVDATGVGGGGMLGTGGTERRCDFAASGTAGLTTGGGGTGIRGRGEAGTARAIGLGGGGTADLIAGGGGTGTRARGLMGSARPVARGPSTCGAGLAGALTDRTGFEAG